MLRRFGQSGGRPRQTSINLRVRAMMRLDYRLTVAEVDLAGLVMTAIVVAEVSIMVIIYISFPVRP